MSTRPECTECGWIGTPTTPARAEYSARQHRCSRERWRRDMAARAAARRTADGVHRDCQHKIARHVHGTRAAYVLDRCRCRACRDGNQAAEQERKRLQAYGRWEPYVDAEPVRQHVAALRAGGMGLKRIAAVSGVPHGALWKLVQGKRRADGTCVPSRRVRPSTARQVLAVTLDVDTLAGGARTARTGTLRRLQALVALGWSQAELGRRLGINDANMTPLVQGRRDVTVRTARAVADLYADLSDCPPPETNKSQRISASRSRNRAAAAGWLVPAWWDDDTMDDPTADPRAAETPHRGPGRPVGHLLEDVEWLANAGMSIHSIAAQLGVTANSIERAHQRAGAALPQSLSRAG